MKNPLGRRLVLVLFGLYFLIPMAASLVVGPYRLGPGARPVDPRVGLVWRCACDHDDGLGLARHVQRLRAHPLGAHPVPAGGSALI